MDKGVWEDDFQDVTEIPVVKYVEYFTEFLSWQF